MASLSIIISLHCVLSSLYASDVQDLFTVIIVAFHLSTVHFRQNRSVALAVTVPR